MSKLTDTLKSMIEAEGAIPVARFMQLCMTMPRDGYYAADDPLGSCGDFMTAPEISQMFGEMIGIWVASVWMKQGRPKKFVMLELGPGRGTMMADLLRATAHVEGFHDALQLYLYDCNKTLRNVQRKALTGFNPRHIHEWSDLPELPLFVIANEFFDAMPVRQYKLMPQGWREIMVTCHHDEFLFIEGTTPVELPLLARSPYFEVSPQGLAHAHHLCSHIAKHGGAGLIIDYGYAQPNGQLSLQAVRDHVAVKPLSDPGEVDLSADVDFESIAQVARKVGIHVMPIIHQSEFLMNMGIEIRASKLKTKATPEQCDQIDQDLRRLCDPSEMGTLFKVLAVSSQKDDEMAGF